MSGKEEEVSEDSPKATTASSDMNIMVMAGDENLVFPEYQSRKLGKTIPEFRTWQNEKLTGKAFEGVATYTNRKISAPHMSEVLSSCGSVRAEELVGNTTAREVRTKQEAYQKKSKSAILMDEGVQK